jgi:Flp pilus assembly protein TadG
MIMRRPENRRRHGATVVETALVLTTALLLLFGVYEYGRFLMMRQLVENAAREGARFAIAHTNDRTTQDVENEVRYRLAGLDAQLDTLVIDITGIVLRDRTDPNTNITYTRGTPLASWDQASPTDGVRVAVRGDFRPLLPSLLQMDARIPIDVRAVMFSEGN